MRKGLAVDTRVNGVLGFLDFLGFLFRRLASAKLFLCETVGSLSGEDKTSRKVARVVVGAEQ